MHRAYRGIMSTRAFEIQNLDVGTAFQDYGELWQLQRELHAEVVSGARSDVFLLLEHEPVFTAGRRTEDSDLPSDGAPVIEVDRGGRITWHGPGQLVCYAITRLPQPLDVVAHVRRLEQLMIRVCADFGITAYTIEGRSGVWVDSHKDSPSTPNKIGAVGVRVAQGVTLHGLSLNVNCDLTWAQNIVPCGISDAGVTSLSRELGIDITTAEVVGHVIDHLASFWSVDPSPDSEPTSVAPTATAALRVDL